jgi:hypothetical protein
VKTGLLEVLSDLIVRVLPDATVTSAGAESSSEKANTSLAVLYRTAHRATIEPPDAVHDGFDEKYTATLVVPVCDNVTLTPPVVYPLPEATSLVTAAHVVDPAAMLDVDVTRATL